jgi:hypothetical protein
MTYPAGIAYSPAGRIDLSFPIMLLITLYIHPFSSPLFYPILRTRMNQRRLDDSVDRNR